MGLSTGEEVNMELNINIGVSSEMASNPSNVQLTAAQKVFGLLAARMDIGIDAGLYEELGAFTKDTYTRKMTIGSTYESSEGKFPAAYGNVALLDCHYLLQYMYDFAVNVIKPDLPFWYRPKF